MLALTNWQYVIRDLLKSNLSKPEIRGRIIADCLLSDKKMFGSYQVDANKVWDYILTKDLGCVGKMQELRIEDVYDVLAYYEEIEYKKMRGTYPHRHHKKG